MAHPVVHAEIRSQDPDATRKFFSDLLGWTYPAEGAVPGYTFVDTGVPDALYTAISPLQGGQDLVTFFIGVDDINQVVAQAAQLGGTVVQEPRQAPGVSFALIADPQGHIVGLAQFWTQALGWKILSEREREIVIGTDDNAPVGICFMPVTDAKTVKNRVHLDLTSSAADRDQEIDRLLALGARRADIGQTGAESWTVLADPEGNEFCVVRPKETLTR